MAAFGSLTLSWPRVWAHHACCFIRSANSDIPTLFNFQPVPQPRCRHSISSFGRSKPTREVFQWIFWHLFRSTSRHRGHGFVQTEVSPWCRWWPWSFCIWLWACQEMLFEYIYIYIDTTRFQTAPWQELLALDLTSFGCPCCIRGACECCAHAQRSGGKGEGVRVRLGSSNAIRTGPRPRWNKQKQTMKAVVVCIDVEICGWTWDLYILVMLLR